MGKKLKIVISILIIMGFIVPSLFAQQRTAAPGRAIRSARMAAQRSGGNASVNRGGGQAHAARNNLSGQGQQQAGATEQNAKEGWSSGTWGHKTTPHNQSEEARQAKIDKLDNNQQHRSNEAWGKAQDKVNEAKNDMTPDERRQAREMINISKQSAQENYRTAHAAAMEKFSEARKAAMELTGEERAEALKKATEEKNAALKAAIDERSACYKDDDDDDDDDADETEVVN